MGLPSEIITGLIGSSGYSGYQIDQSMLLDGSSDYLNWTAGTATDSNRWTYSTWIKRSELGQNQSILNAGISANDAGYFDIQLRDTDKLSLSGYSTVWRMTSQVFRDVGAYGHLVVAVDTDQATPADRIKIYWNGVQITDFDTENNPGSGNNIGVNVAGSHRIGRHHNAISGNNNYFNGYMSEINFVDGQQLEPTYFGEFYNGTTAWRPIQPSGLTYGTNGFYLPFTQDTPNLGTDYSGNGNDWTENGSPVQSSDSPTVNYATWNLLSTDAVTLSEGNLLTNAPGYWSAVAATIPLSKNSGKVFIQTLVGHRLGSYSGQGLVPSEVPITDAGPSLYYGPLDSTTTPNSGLGADFNNAKFGFYDTVGTTSYTFYEPDDTTVYSTNDLYCFHAFDFDNERYWVGTAFTTDSAVTWWGPSGKGADPTNPSTGLDISAYLAKFPDSQHWYFAHAPNNVSGNPTARLDCGQNGYAFSGAKPEDYNDLSAVNLPDPTITDGSNNFKTTTWTGYTPTLYEQTRISSSTTINNSMVLDGSSDYLTFTPSSSGTTRTFTIEAFVKKCENGRRQSIVGINGSPAWGGLFFESDDTLKFQLTDSFGNNLVTSRKFRDVGSFYHIILAVDTTESTSSDRLKLWVNGVQQTSFSVESYPSLNQTSYFSSTSGTMQVGRLTSSAYLDAYVATFRFIDDTAYSATDFGEFNSDNIWSPKAVSGLTYGTNGVFLPFTQDTPNLGTDYSGNGNDWTENGSPTQSSDSPTVNYATFNVVDIRQSGAIFSEGNLRFSTSTAAVQKAASTIAFDASGHYYAEFLVNATSGTNRESIGIINTANFDDNNNAGGYGANEYCIRLDDGNKYNNNSEVAYGDSYAATDVVGVRVDNGSLYFYKNGTIQNSGVPAYTGISGSCRFFVTIDDGGTNPDITARFNSTDWTIGTPPTGANDLSSANLPAISDSDLYFNGGSADLVWIKSRSAATSHKLIDTVRGVGLNLSSDSSAVETGEATVNRIDKYGIHLGDDADVNNAAATYVAWMWKAGGAGVVNTDGTISSTVSANDDAGFSLVTYGGNGTSGATVGHGLSAAPMMIIKPYDYAEAWQVYHSYFGGTHRAGELSNAAVAAALSNRWNNTDTGASVFTLGNHASVNSSSYNYVGLIFRSIPGYSKVFSYTGNGSTDGPFVYLGFKPRWVMTKRATISSSGWCIHDTERSPYNLADVSLRAETNAAEAGDGDKDILSNGFKVRNTGAEDNYNGSTYIGIAFAENPFGGSNLPLALAR